jgi:hypothetical protein
LKGRALHLQEVNRRCSAFTREATRREDSRDYINLNFVSFRKISALPSDGAT